MTSKTSKLSKEELLKLVYGADYQEQPNWNAKEAIDSFNEEQAVIFERYCWKFREGMNPDNINVASHNGRLALAIRDSFAIGKEEGIYSKLYFSDGVKATFNELEQDAQIDVSRLAPEEAIDAIQRHPTAYWFWLLDADKVDEIKKKRLIID